MVDAIKGIRALRNVCKKVYISEAELRIAVDHAEDLLERVPLPHCDICDTPTPNKSMMVMGTDTLACDDCRE